LSWSFRNAGAGKCSASFAEVNAPSNNRSELVRFLRDFTSHLYFCYRRGFSRIEGKLALSSDAVWGAPALFAAFVMSV
jgi:hypothetical protein